MRIASLAIQNLRVILNLRVEPGGKVNWLIGPNGSGKTTVLEALFLLARGRSFKGIRHGPLTRQGATESRVCCTVESGENVKFSINFIEKSGRKKLYENGSVVRRVRDLKDRIQVRVVGENAQGLLEASPAIRRLFLDWNLFHVEHSYFEIHSAFLRALSQRNAWLRTGAKGKRIWDERYVLLSESLTALRQKFVSDLQAELVALHDLYPELPRVILALDRGWLQSTDLVEKLEENFVSDMQRGYTLYGPSRADLKAEVVDRKGVGSRGQAKAVVCLLQYAAQSVLESRTGTPCIWLLDDIRSELDLRTFNTLWAVFEDIDHQVFATGLDDCAIINRGNGDSGVRLFHVEHGSLKD